MHLLVYAYINYQYNVVMQDMGKNVKLDSEVEQFDIVDI